MPAYRTAHSQEMLERVNTYKYDKKFNNWIDPEVLQKYTSKSKKKVQQLWEKALKLKGAGQIKRYGSSAESNKGIWKQLCHTLVSDTILRKIII